MSDLTEQQYFSPSVFNELSLYEFTNWLFH
jgi:hypothetical protein